MIDFDKDIKYFMRWQFDDPRTCYIGSGWLINPELVYMLDELIERTGWNIIPHHSVGGCVVLDEKMNDKRFCLDKHHLQSHKHCAVDFHFETNAPPREQFWEVYSVGFTGIGIFTNLAIGTYNRDEFDILPVAFHVDLRSPSEAQIWTCDKRGHNKYLFEEVVKV